MSTSGLLLIKSFEGFRPQAVRRRDGVLTIGYGHIKTARTGIAITEAEAGLLLQYDLLPVIEAIHTHIQTPLNQHQFDALASFILSIGVERFLASDVLEHLNAGSIQRAGDSLSGWPDRVQPPVDAPYRRRSAERALFDAKAGRDVSLDQLLTAPVQSPLRKPFAADEEVQTPETVSVLRHETSTAKSGYSADLGAFVFICSIGILALTAGTLAFRRALPMSHEGDGAIIVGGFLLLMGLIFIGAAGWNLFKLKHNKRFS